MGSWDLSPITTSTQEKVGKEEGCSLFLRLRLCLCNLPSSPLTLVFAMREPFPGRQALSPFSGKETRQMTDSVICSSQAKKK